MTDKILCPWCGEEMKPAVYKRRADWEVEYSCRKCGASGPIQRASKEKDAEEAARAVALQRHTPPIKPMTLEGVWKEDDPMWVEHKNGALYIGDFYMSMSAKNGWDVQTLGSVKPRLLLEDYYGKTWRCWERRPTDEERSAAEWG